jgi:SNF2 family DNA or RNA helicase
MGYIYKTQPFEHQRQALIEGADKSNFAYFMEMGTGKTKVSIDNMAYLYQEEKVNVVLVVAPNSVYHNWKNEISTHCPVDTTIHTHKQDKKFVYKSGALHWFLINVEAFSHSSGVKAVQSLINEYYDTMCMIIDESTTIKNRSAKRTKSLIKIAEKIKYKRILTGSPITKSPLDLFSQCKFLDEALLGFNNFYSFRARYCHMKSVQLSNGGRQIALPLYFTNLNELEKKVKSFSFRVKKEDCLDLPSKIYQKRLITLSSEQQTLYNSLRTFARAVFQDQEASYSNKLTEIIKLHQVCNGFFVSDEGEKKSLTNAKLTELINILEEIDGKVIIWANYVHNIETIIDTLNKKFGQDTTVAIYGAVSVEDRNKAVRDFQTNKGVRFFIGNPSTGGYGLNLTQATTVIYFSNSYNLEVRQQSEDRAHRIGQKNKVTYIDLVADKTIDEFILKALNKKLKISAQTLGEEVLEFL